MDIRDKYKIRALGEFREAPGEFGLLTVGVFRRRPDPAGILTGDDQWEQVGQFERNYQWAGPFAPFVQNGKEYALYSRDYTATRVMSLPDCVDIAGEEPDAVGYCPLDLYVPATPVGARDFGYNRPPYEDFVNGQFGFVSGCYWAMESYNPIYYLDLSRITEGVMTRDMRLGEIQHPHPLELAEAIDVRWYEPTHRRIEVKGTQDVYLDRNLDFDVEGDANRLLETIMGLLVLKDEVRAQKVLVETLKRYYLREAEKA